MIVGSLNCGCLPTKKPSLIIEPVGSRASCLSYGFHQSAASHYRHRQRAQRYFPYGGSKHAYLTSKNNVCCCISRKHFSCAPARLQRNIIPFEYKSSVLPQYSNYCAMHATRLHSAHSRRQINTAVIYAPMENVGEQYLRNESKSKLKKHKVEETPTERIVSEIVRKGQPYKEIEAIFNNNHVILRKQKEPVKEEYDPPCECIGQDTAAEESNLKECDDGVVFEMPNGNLELCRTPRADASLTKKTCDQEETGCRTMILYPNVKDANCSTPSYAANERMKRSKMGKSLDLEENPNIFVLRIRNHRNSNDKKQKIDLEFRALRPWQIRKDEKEKRIYSEKHEENNDMENKVPEKLENHKEDTAEQHEIEIPYQNIKNFPVLHS